MPVRIIYGMRRTYERHGTCDLQGLNSDERGEGIRVWLDLCLSHFCGIAARLKALRGTDRAPNTIRALKYGTSDEKNGSVSGVCIFSNKGLFQDRSWENGDLT